MAAFQCQRPLVQIQAQCLTRMQPQPSTTLPQISYRPLPSPDFIPSNHGAAFTTTGRCCFYEYVQHQNRRVRCAGTGTGSCALGFVGPLPLAGRWESLSWLFLGRSALPALFSRSRLAPRLERPSAGRLALSPNMASTSLEDCGSGGWRSGWRKDPKDPAVQSLVVDRLGC